MHQESIQNIMNNFMKYKKIDINGKLIHVFDEVFTYAQKQKYYDFLRNSYYNATGGANVSIETLQDVALTSVFDEEDLDNFDILNNLPEEILDILNNFKPRKSYSLLNSYSQITHFHTDDYEHTNNLTFLYYANINWHRDWGGETMFSDDNIENIEYTSLYIPGRIIIFDSTIPHKPCPPVYGSPQFRYTFVINFKRK